MTIYDVVLLLFILGITYDLTSLKKEVSRLNFELRKKVNKPPVETPMEAFSKRRSERIARLEKEDELKASPKPYQKSPQD